MNQPETDTENWYERAFRSEYLEVYPARTVKSAEAEVAAALNWLQLNEGARLLDLCCGAGRHSRWLRESPIELHGLDLSKDLLAEARRLLADSVSLHQGDMRQLPFVDQFFDAVVMFFTSFGYFPTDEENYQVLTEVARVVRPGGSFLLDLPDRDSTANGLVPVSDREVGDLKIHEERRMTADGLRVEKTVTLIGPGGEDHYTESVRLFLRDDIEEMLQKSGWESIDCRGDWDGSTHGSGASPRMIFTAKKMSGGVR